MLCHRSSVDQEQTRSQAAPALRSAPPARDPHFILAAAAWCPSDMLNDLFNH